METETISNNLHDALLYKSKDKFWNTWKSKYGANKKRPSTIDGVRDDNIIANNLANYFSKTCSVNSDKKALSFFEKFNDNMKSYVGDNWTHDFTISVQLIDEIIFHLEKGKAAGLDGLTAEHLKFSHPIVTSLLSKLFRLMLKINYVPAGFGLGVTIPIPKHDSLHKIISYDDFRGITISPVISKVLKVV